MGWGEEGRRKQCLRCESVSTLPRNADTDTHTGAAGGEGGFTVGVDMIDTHKYFYSESDLGTLLGTYILYSRLRARLVYRTSK